MNVNDPKLNKNVKKFGMKTDYIDKILFKDIYHYRIDFFEKKVNKRTEEIINDINTRKNANKNKRIVKIPINKKCRKTSENKLKCKFQGNENLFIDQTNTNGRVVDYAFLFGERENKKLVLFQMKCYSNYTSLADLFVNKNEIKEKLSPMLLNSIKLFNCLISEWFYILVFYYNIKDSFTSYIGIKTISSCINKDIEYLLYDPIQDLFYLNSKEIKESENLELMTIDSNLDQFSFCNTINIMSLTHFNNDKLTNPLIKKNHDEGLLKFVEEMNKINIDYKALQRILKVDFLIYYCHYILENDTITPEKNLIILYKKKNSNYFVSVKSGPAWSNSTSMKKQKEQFRTARRVFNTSRKTVPTMCIEGCCYGNDNKGYNDSDHEKYCGEKFWTLISGESTLFVDIIEPLGYKAKEKNEEYYKAYNQMLNKFVREFVNEYCNDNNDIEWDKIVRLNAAVKQTKENNK